MKTLTTFCSIALLTASVGTWAQDRDATAAQSQAQSGASEDAAAKDSEDAAAKEQASRLDSIRDFSVERRTEAVAAARRATDELDRQIERLQAQVSEGWSRMSMATKERSQKEMADLRARRNALAEWIGGMQHGSSSAWTELKTGFRKSYDELAAALVKARAEFRQAPAGKPATPPEKPADEQEG
jgi:hypothetical protein